MMHAAMLAGISLLMLRWRPCRSREGRLPRTAVAMLLLSSAGLWAGTLAMVLHCSPDRRPDWSRRAARRGACLLMGRFRHGVWGRPRRGCWPSVRAGWKVGGRLVDAGRLRGRLAATVRRLDSHPATVVVDDLGTPAMTVGVYRPLVAVDADFWASASSVQHAVILAHEHAHRRGGHGLIEAAAVWLTAPLPQAAAAKVLGCVRRHLAALADDAAARSCGRRHAGRAVVELSLAAARPAAGLAVAGDGLWRARRLLTPPAHATTLDRLLVQGPGATMGLCAAFVAVQAAVLLTSDSSASYCPL